LQADKASQLVFKNGGESLLRVDASSDKRYSLFVDPQNGARLPAESVKIQLRRMLKVGRI
jgi:hypothetical protein